MSRRYLLEREPEPRRSRTHAGEHFRPGRLSEVCKAAYMWKSGAARALGSNLQRKPACLILLTLVLLLTFWVNSNHITYVQNVRLEVPRSTTGYHKLGSTTPSSHSHSLGPAVDHFNRSQCPKWLLDYEAWHQAHRGTPGAQYLIAEVAQAQLGIGDYLRGFMYALRVAAGLQRVLLLRWENPGTLTDFLVPGSGIDWTWDGTPAQALLGPDNALTSNPDVHIMGVPHLHKTFPNNTLFSHNPSNKTFLVIRGNTRAEAQCGVCPPLKGTLDYASVCMFRFLFKPSVQVQQLTNLQLAALYPKYGAGSTKLPYSAVHLRLGKLAGETEVINRMAQHVDALENFMLAISCGTGLATESGLAVSGPSSTPLLLLADHSWVRSFVQQGRLANVVSPSYSAVHTALATQQSGFDAHMSSFVDLNLMARATCLVMSRSGFSDVGWWMGGGTPCKMRLWECYARCNSSFAGTCT